MYGIDETGAPDTPAGRAWNAVMTGEHTTLATLVSQHGGKAATDAVGNKTGTPITALGAAAAAGDSLAVKTLVDGGADPHRWAAGWISGSPMANAIVAQSVACVELLFTCERWRENQNPQGIEDWAHLAVEDRNRRTAPDDERVLKALLARKARATQQALIEAVRKGKVHAATLLLDHGAQADEADEQAIMPLAACIQLGDEDRRGPRMIKLLHDRGAKPDTWCGPSETRRPPALVAAIEAGQLWAVQCLMHYGSNVDGARVYIRSMGIRDIGSDPAKVRRALEALL